METNALNRPRIQRWAGLLILLTMLWTVAMGIQASQFDSRLCDISTKCGPPVACLELAKSADLVRDLINAGGPTLNSVTLRYNTYMDCIFILLYCGSFILLAQAFSGTRLFPGIATFLVIVAGVFDYAENYRMLHELSSDLEGLSDSYVKLTATVSLVKWLALALVLCLLAVIFYKVSHRGADHSRILKIIGFLFVLSALGIVAGVFRTTLIRWWTLPFSFAFLLSLFLFRPLAHKPAS